MRAKNGNVFVPNEKKNRIRFLIRGQTNGIWVEEEEEEECERKQGIGEKSSFDKYSIANSLK